MLWRDAHERAFRPELRKSLKSNVLDGVHRLLPLFGYDSEDYRINENETELRPPRGRPAGVAAGIATTMQTFLETIVDSVFHGKPRLRKIITPLAPALLSGGLLKHAIPPYCLHRTRRLKLFSHNKSWDRRKGVFRAAAGILTGSMGAGCPHHYFI